LEGAPLGTLESWDYGGGYRGRLERRIPWLGMSLLN
jgi:hypothetical protein